MKWGVRGGGGEGVVRGEGEGGGGAIKLGRSYCNITIYLTVFTVVINLRVKWSEGVVRVRG